MHMPESMRAKFWAEQLKSYPDQHEITPELRDHRVGPQMIMGPRSRG